MNLRLLIACRAAGPGLAAATRAREGVLALAAAGSCRAVGPGPASATRARVSRLDSGAADCRAAGPEPAAATRARERLFQLEAGPRARLRVPGRAARPPLPAPFRRSPRWAYEGVAIMASDATTNAAVARRVGVMTRPSTWLRWLTPSMCKTSANEGMQLCPEVELRRRTTVPRLHLERTAGRDLGQEWERRCARQGS